MLVVVFPLVVGCLVVTEQEERAIFWTSFEHREGLVSDEIGHVTVVLLAHPPGSGTRGRDTSPGRAGCSRNRSPRDRSSGATCRRRPCNTRRLEQARKRRLPLVERIEVLDAVSVGIFAREDRRPAWRADRVGHEAIGEPHALRGDAVDLGCRVDLEIITTDRLRAWSSDMIKRMLGRLGAARRLGIIAEDKSGQEAARQANGEPYRVVSRRFDPGGIDRESAGIRSSL